MISRFKKTPVEIMRILHLFKQNNLSYNLFKCEHIFEGANKNLDILFKEIPDYSQAASLLEKEGYALYLPERIEKYKKMYTFFESGVVTRIHLHREIAWHGLRVLDKKPVFSRAKMLSSVIFVPSPEDQLLIHVAHIVFENLSVSAQLSQLINHLTRERLDWAYIHHALEKCGWKSSFNHVLSSMRKEEQPRKIRLILSFAQKAMMTPSSWRPLLGKSISIAFRPFNFGRKGCLIALVGVNGSGKTTLTKNLLASYFPLSRTVNGQFGYYFGWTPVSPVSKIVSQRFKKRGRSVFKEMNLNYTPKTTKKLRLFREAFFLFNYFEYLLRYFFFIRQKLRRNQLVITDRYFYDLYGQYNASEKSIILPLLFRLYPKPDFLFVLDADVEMLKSRGKLGERRIVKGDLAEQRRRYLLLSKRLGAIVINTTHSISENVNTIIDCSWKKLVRANY